MKEFINVLRRFVPPYKKYLVLSVLFNILSVILNIFSFAALIPILQIIFKTDDAKTATALMAWDWEHAQAVLMNNMNYYVNGLIADIGPTTTLLIIGLFLAVMTGLKTGAYFLSSATIVPIRTGVVRDIRNQLYQKINALPLGFFSEERKGDIIARMSGDVQEIENSIMSSLEMLFKNPILIIGYFAMLLFISWQLTVFTEGSEREGAGTMERHDESGGRDTWRPPHHQGLLCRGEDEPSFRHHQFCLPQ